MPNHLVLVRHGESEGNVANKHSKKGDDQDYTKKFRYRHSSLWRLTDLGIQQAKAAGQWINDNLTTNFNRYYASEYLRAMETASYLNLPNAEWYVDFYLREREWGDMDVLTFKECKEQFADSIAFRERDPFYWTSPNGESMAQLCLRVDRILDTLHRECEGKKVIIVGHGEVMWAFMVRLERMTQQRFIELDQSKNPHDRIHNCQILHYSRVNPDTQEISPYLSWKRSICPWDPSLSSNDWQQIYRTRYSNDVH